MANEILKDKINVEDSVEHEEYFVEILYQKLINLTNKIKEFDKSLERKIS